VDAHLLFERVSGFQWIYTRRRTFVFGLWGTDTKIHLWFLKLFNGELTQKYTFGF
jgi:hypothetical protein